jgi:NADH:ubiquinone oxidoreductase subunit F (NADH-binding)
MHATVDIPSRPRVVLKGDPVPSVAAYRARGGGEALRVARSLGPWRTAEEVTLSGLRGRGRGGFRTGRKWLLGPRRQPNYRGRDLHRPRVRLPWALKP